ncbi:hypothetical protein GE21DRAFT_5041 [Neurospora crassa]|uniref:Uncharacterized protein n=1 Tax=Neurospora crassa (strain ATCC 24698 / 74-OR23-1A / CBS 708.71 / DSM 1257 / FGSC 987) TaxID=367110 RepID=Q7S3I5_NEUCR|nr:hypothetical protein NCU08258 [Neurospora crassa OR74A]EAA30112.2 hypothetical protein NCU08258 [Neurospora crassa OR74A]KHE86517.1 hypothetical protein GE21DRAFT_5041 [Neurospora crassa]|eukprot:XP_959348.2 hypothetical protein NCU08258 [Neurospora crassa OR74A]
MFSPGSHAPRRRACILAPPCLPPLPAKDVTTTAASNGHDPSQSMDWRRYRERARGQPVARPAQASSIILREIMKPSVHNSSSSSVGQRNDARYIGSFSTERVATASRRYNGTDPPTAILRNKTVANRGLSTILCQARRFFPQPFALIVRVPHSRSVRTSIPRRPSWSP